MDDPLSIADQEALKTILLAAFPDRNGVDNLNTLVEHPLGYSLFVEFGGGTIGMADIATPLIQRAEADGATTLLVRTLFVARPGDVLLRDWVQRCRPALMALVPDSAHAQAMITTATDGVETLRLVAAARPDVRAQLDAAHIDLAKVPQEINRLALYKGLHDVLHKVQVPLYRSILDNLEDFSTDPSCAETLSDYSGQLVVLVADARDVLDRGVLDTGATATETSWIDKLADATDQLGKAADARDRTGVLRQSLMLKAILRAHPPRLDAALVAAARNIPFGSLVGTMSVVAETLRDGSPERLALNDAVTALIQLSADVSSRVCEHESWQAIEVNFWATEDAIQRRDDAAVDEFSAYWTVLEQQIGTLSTTSPGDWVASLDSSANTFRSLFPQPAAPPVADGARRAFFRYVNAGRLRFYLLDKELKARCDKVTGLSKPLSDLIDGIRS